MQVRRICSRRMHATGPEEDIIDVANILGGRNSVALCGKTDELVNRMLRTRRCCRLTGGSRGSKPVFIDLPYDLLNVAMPEAMAAFPVIDGRPFQGMTQAMHMNG